MPANRLRRLVQGQGGSTLIELLVAMPIATVLLGLVVHALGQAGLQQQDIEHRTEAQTDAQIGLERMTREARQANWLYFRSSSVVDMEVGVRPTATGSATPRLVRWDCSSDVCSRSEAGPTTYPPPMSPVFAKTTTEIGAPAAGSGNRYGVVTGPDVFTPTSVNPVTGQQRLNFVAPDFLYVRLRFEVDDRGEHFVLEDGVSLRNRTTFADD